MSSVWESHSCFVFCRCVWCRHCGATSPGLRCEWQNNYTQCAPCASLSTCPVCCCNYREEELILQCRQCDRSGFLIHREYIFFPYHRRSFTVWCRMRTSLITSLVAWIYLLSSLLELWKNNGVFWPPKNCFERDKPQLTSQVKQKRKPPPAWHVHQMQSFWSPC